MLSVNRKSQSHETVPAMFSTNLCCQFKPLILKSAVFTHKSKSLSSSKILPFCVNDRFKGNVPPALRLSTLFGETPPNQKFSGSILII